MREQVENLRAGAPRNRAVLPLKRQGKERASKRAQTALRDQLVRRWDSATGVGTPDLTRQTVA